MAKSFPGAQFKTLFEARCHISRRKMHFLPFFFKSTRHTPKLYSAIFIQIRLLISLQANYMVSNCTAFAKSFPGVQIKTLFEAKCHISRRKMHFLPIFFLSTRHPQIVLTNFHSNPFINFSARAKYKVSISAIKKIRGVSL